MVNEIVKKSVLDRRADYAALNDEIWEYAETAFSEYKSMDAICAFCEKEGFTIQKGVGNVPTAFTCTYGSGKPVIGYLAEYDALAAINQKKGSAKKEPTSPDKAGANGHGCAHNCLGAGCVAAAVAVKDYLKATGKSGTVIVFGCPGEEGGSGKAFMAREGVFKGVDACISWHGGSVTRVATESYNANYQVLFRFKGTAAHAANASQGRSALDAVELMNTGVQYLREHMPDGYRIHYAILDTGGYSPNVVQPTASVLYLIRAPRVKLVDELYKRVCKCAEGAAVMTETEWEADFVKGCSNIMTNGVLNELLQKNLEAVGAPKYDEEEIKLAEAMIGTYGVAGGDDLASVLKLADADNKDKVKELFKEKKALNDFIVPLAHHAPDQSGSSDVGDVSMNCPTSWFYAVTNSAGCPGHSWQFVAQTATSTAHKGVWFAGEVLANATVDMLNDPTILEKAKAEFDANTNGEEYMCPIPKGTVPRAISDLF